MNRFERCVVRLYGSDNPASSRKTIQGAGFLVDDKHIVTCHHVVEKCAEDGTVSAGNVVELDFPFVPGEKKVLRASVDFSRKDEHHDIAGLTLVDPAPAAACTPPLVAAPDYWEHRWRAPGFPRNSDTGEYAEGTFLGVDAREWIMIKSDTAQGRRIQKGYSGGPVYDSSLRAIAGMVVAADSQPQERVAFMIPMEVLVRSWSLVLKGKVQGPNPYQGLEAFDERTADRFFGRERLIGELTARLEKVPMFVLWGDSGSGKSSLIGAGLVPEIQNHGWKTLIINGVGPEPFESLAGELLRDTTVTDRPFSEQVSALAKALEKNGLETDLRHAAGADQDGRLLIVIDQLEQLFTTCSDEVARDSFLDRLAQLGQTTRKDVRTSLLLCIRSDYLDRLQHRPVFAGACRTSSAEVLPLGHDDLRRAISEPALRAGAAFEAGLVDRMVRDVEGEPGSLPQLQFVLTSLWDEQENGELNERAYESLGGVQGALARRADEFLADITPGEKEVVKRIFLQLVHVGRDDKGMRRPVTEKDLFEEDWSIVELLADQRLVVTGRDGEGKRTASIAHEALVVAWPLLRQWVEATSAELEILDMQADAAIKRHAIGAFPAGPVASLILLVPIWAKLGRRIGRIYGIDLDWDASKKMTKKSAKAFSAYLGGSGTVHGLASVARGAGRLTPAGVVVVSVAQAGFASAATYVAGHAWKRYFRLRYLGAPEPDFEEIARATARDLRRSFLRRPTRLRKTADPAADDEPPAAPQDLGAG